MNKAVKYIIIMPPGSFSSFYVWKIPFIKENVKHSQTKKVKDAISK